MKKNILLIAIATVIAIIMTMTSCNGNDNNNALKGAEVVVTLPSSKPMTIKTGCFGDIIKAGSFVSKDGQTVHIEYCLIYNIQDEDVTPLARALEGRNIPEDLRGDQYYYQLYVQPVIMNTLKESISQKTAAEVSQKDLAQEIQQALDNASLIYQTTFKMQLGILAL